MNNFKRFLENHLDNHPAGPSLTSEVKASLRNFLQSSKDFQLLYLVYHLIVEAHYKEPKKIYDFVVFLYPESGNQDEVKKRLSKLIKLSLEWFQ